MILFKQTEVYGPDRLGFRDVLTAGGKIIKISDKPIDTGDLEVLVIEGNGKILIPGLIDAHVHICGGGGEGGFKTRTPEMRMTEMITAGVTSVVGCLGTDGIARSMENLLAKVYGLREEGVSAWCYSGSYQVPVRTLTDELVKDVMMIEPIIGVGEIAINDHRSSSPTAAELARIASDARVAGILSGKAGVVNCHLGDGPFDLELIETVIRDSVIPISQFYPTHMNRNARLFEKAIEFALKGGMVDLTTSTRPVFIQEGEVPAAEALARLLSKGVSVDRITFTSDGHGSLPEFDSDGVFKGLSVGKLDSLMESVIEAVKKYKVPLELAIRTVTASPAQYLKLNGKGFVKEGGDADLVLLDAETYAIDTVVSNGRLCLYQGQLQVKETFKMEA